MRKMCPCYKCESGGQYHTRCDKFKSWDIEDKQEKAKIEKERYKHKDADEFTSSVIFKQRRKARI